jgi:hypothetical protein
VQFLFLEIQVNQELILLSNVGGVFMAGKRVTISKVKDSNTTVCLSSYDVIPEELILRAGVHSGSDG